MTAAAETSTQPSPALRRLAWATVAATIVFVGVDLWLASASRSWAHIAQSIPFVSFPVVGAILAIKRPRNPFGWLMLAIGITWTAPLELYADYALGTRHGALPGGAYALALNAPSWVPFIGLSGFMLLLFPDGHLPSRGWRWLAWPCGVGLVIAFFAILFGAGDFGDFGFPNVSNPLGIDALDRLFPVLVVFVGSAPAIVIGGAAALIVRMRRTRDDVERHQLRWLAWTGGLIAILYLIAFIPNSVLSAGWSNVAATVAILVFSLIPVTIGIAVLRYRLYEIDVVIRKTVVVAAIALFFTFVYVAIVGGIGALVQAHSTTVLSFVAAAIVAALFQPVLAWARRLADRIVYGKRATPYELLADFGRNLGGTYDAQDVLPRIARVLGEGIGAARARVLLRVGERLREVAVWPAEADRSRADDATVEVRDQGEVLGALAVAMPVNDPLDPTKVTLVADLARQAGIVLRNVRLTTDLRERLDELAAAQRRIVTAQDRERRRLERDIHDGAQQQLVALAVKARLARSLVERDARKAAEMLDQIGSETQDALENLRDLARGIYPPLLADKGLGAALEAQARKAPLPVRVAADGLGRYPQEVEAALYFSILEALQNAGKYAHASSVEVRLAQTDGRVEFRVRDDGEGFDPAAVGYGTGLQGIVDRLSALGGELQVRSDEGSGTTITGTVPARACGPTPSSPIDREPGEASERVLDRRGEA